ncbi:hypothetical protein C0J52_12175 [Blattella germanica]|nr:hypothetical protein C0J52_12175 [Blattella germanica]
MLKMKISRLKPLKFPEFVKNSKMLFLRLCISRYRDFHGSLSIGLGFHTKSNQQCTYEILELYQRCSAKITISIGLINLKINKCIEKRELCVNNYEQL